MNYTSSDFQSHKHEGLLRSFQSNLSEAAVRQFIGDEIPLYSRLQDLQITLIAVYCIGFVAAVFLAVLLSNGAVLPGVAVLGSAAKPLSKALSIFFFVCAALQWRKHQFYKNIHTWLNGLSALPSVEFESLRARLRTQPSHPPA